MRTPAELYVREIRRRLNYYFAAWLPNEELKLGDVGILEGEFFRRTTTLEKLDFSFTERPDTSPTPIDLVSQQGTSFTLKISGEANDAIPALPVNKAGFSLSFSNEGAFVFQAAESFEPSIEDIATLNEQILQAYKEGKWGKNWAVITKIVKVPYATCIISNSSNSEIIFETDAALKQGIVDLGNMDTNLMWRKQTGDLIKMIGARDISPFFQLSKLKRRWPFGQYYVSMKMSQIFPPTLSLESITPQIVREDKEVEDSLVLDVISYLGE